MKSYAQKFILLLLILAGGAIYSFAIETAVMQKMAIDFIANNLEIFPDKYNGPIKRFIDSKSVNIFCLERRYNHLNYQRQKEAYDIFDTMKSMTYLYDDNKKARYNIYYLNFTGIEKSAETLGDLFFTLDCHDPFYDKNHYWYMIISVRSNKNDHNDGEIIYLKFKDKKVINYYFKYWIA